MHHKQLQAHHMLSQTMHHHDHIQWILVYLTLFVTAKNIGLKNMLDQRNIFSYKNAHLFPKPSVGHQDFWTR